MTREHWNNIVAGRASGMESDDVLPHTICGWIVCTLPIGHEGKCEQIPVASACGDIAFRLGMGPCPLCPPVYDQ